MKQLNEIRGVSATKNSSIYKYAEYIVEYIISPFGLEDDMFNGIVKDDGEFTIKQLDAFKDRLYYKDSIDKFKDIDKYKPEWLGDITFKELDPNEQHAGYYLNTYIKDDKVDGTLAYVEKNNSKEVLLEVIVHELTHAYQKLRNYEKEFTPYNPLYRQASKSKISKVVQTYQNTKESLLSIMENYNMCSLLFYGSQYYADPRETEAYINSVYVNKQTSNNISFRTRTYKLLYDFWTYISYDIEYINKDVLDMLDNNYFNTVIHKNIKDQNKLLKMVSTHYSKLFKKILFKMMSIEKGDNF